MIYTLSIILSLVLLEVVEKKKAERNESHVSNLLHFIIIFLL